MAQCAVRLCEICEHSPGNQYCISCEQYFCNNCKMSHLKAKVSKMHKFEEADKVNPEVKIPKCEQHQESFIFFCNTCNSLLCQVCLTEKHKKHDFLLVTEAVSSKRIETKSNIQSAEKSIDELLTNVSMLYSKLGKFQDHCKTVVNDIDSGRKELKEKIDKVADNYIARIQEHETEESRGMKQEIEQMEMTVREDNALIEDTKKAMEGVDDVMFLVTVIDTRNKLLSLKLSKSNSYVLQSIKFSRTRAQIEEIETLIGSLTIGSLTIGDVRPIRSVKVGDRVKVKACVETPMYDWGSVTNSSIGFVRHISGDFMYVDFPEHKKWQADINDMEFA